MAAVLCKKFVEFGLLLCSSSHHFRNYFLGDMILLMGEVQVWPILGVGLVVRSYTNLSEG